MSLFFVLLGDALFLSDWRQLLFSCCSSWVGCSDKWGGCDAIILLGWKYEAKVSVLPASDGSLVQCRVFRQELVRLLDGGVVGLSQVRG